mgnify:CR=1 FL=1|jgi:hypothetical protein
MNATPTTFSVFFIAQVFFALAGGFALISAGLKLFAPAKSKTGFWLALAGATLGLLQFLFAMFVQLAGEEDSGPKIAEGPPLWFMLLVPALPLIINGALVIAHRRNLNSPVA